MGGAQPGRPSSHCRPLWPRPDSTWTSGMCAFWPAPGAPRPLRLRLEIGPAGPLCTASLGWAPSHQLHSTAPQRQQHARPFASVGGASCVRQAAGKPHLPSLHPCRHGFRLLVGPSAPPVDRPSSLLVSWAPPLAGQWPHHIAALTVRACTSQGTSCFPTVER